MASTKWTIVELVAAQAIAGAEALDFPENLFFLRPAEIELVLRFAQRGEEVGDQGAHGPASFGGFASRVAIHTLGHGHGDLAHGNDRNAGSLSL